VTFPIVTLAAEGIVDFAILRRLVREVRLVPGDEHGGRGKAHLDKRMPGYNSAAKISPWVAARDLDHDAPCAGDLAHKILPKPAKLMRYRIVVRTAESWLFGDKVAFCKEFRVAAKYVPKVPEAIDRPKSMMLSTLSRSSSRDVRDAMVRVDRNGARTLGPEYNAKLSAFAEGSWRPTVAAVEAPSLARARKRLKELAQQLKADSNR
jgi:hypothetical protein